MTSPDTGAHLSDEQFTGLLLGAIPANVTRHLESCPACAEQARRVSGAISSFARQSRLWAERHAATQQRLTAPARHPALAWLQRPAGIAAWSTMVAALVLSATVGLRHMEHASRPIATVAPAAQPVSPATLKADNELLYAIDDELHADTTPPVNRYGLQAANPATHGPRPKRTSD